MFNLRKAFILTISTLLVFISGCSLYTPTKSDSIHLKLGNPSNAANSDHNNYLLVKKQYALSYNRDKGTPNWVSWQLNKSWLGDAPRTNNFRPDDTIPKEWNRVLPNDYTRSGYDKGHMTPSADRSNNPEDNAATFLMTNIIPQAPDNNQGYWAELESYTRSLANEGKEIYIISGGYGQQGTIGKRKVAIPERIFKVIVVSEAGKELDGINESTRVIAVDTPNYNGNKESRWSKYLTTVDELEKKTGYDFLNYVDKSIQKVIEAKVDRGIK
ncbi:MAG: DNA/RNA non-specific endonuclease [Methylacidiphilales bacterium]|nr:DNA/RNA non-specific endonuclease [Candidatus Methylacidiphilales bacterium]NJR17766.1 DNA/RNA non-specific endonuclease [Calothrix sp. CSU_2_0]